MKTLLAKLEAATEGSRGLDALIAVHLGYWGWTPEKWAEALKDPRLNPDGACPDGTPHYTTSLDAGMTLIADQANVYPRIMRSRETGLWTAGLWNVHGMGQVGRGKTAALATVAAALRTRGETE